MGWGGRASDPAAVARVGRGYRGGRETAAGAGASGLEHGVTPPRSGQSKTGGGVGLPYALEYTLEVALRKSPSQPPSTLPFNLPHSVHHHPAIGDARDFAQLAYFARHLQDV